MRREIGGIVDGRSRVPVLALEELLETKLSWRRPMNRQSRRLQHRQGGCKAVCVNISSGQVCKTSEGLCALGLSTTDILSAPLMTGSAAIRTKVKNTFLPQCPCSALNEKA